MEIEHMDRLREDIRAMYAEDPSLIPCVRLYRARTDSGLKESLLAVQDILGKRVVSYAAVAEKACRDAGIPTAALEAGVIGEMVEALKAIQTNAVLGPDVAMRGVSDAYHVPLDDITMVEAILAKLNTKE